MDIAGKGAVVTGAGSGIGRGIALALARGGASVAIADVEIAKAAAVAEEINKEGGRAIAVACDVRDSASIAALADAAWDAFGHVDILVNNAGVAKPAMALDVTDDDFRWQLDVNVVGVFNGMREFGRRFVAQGTPAWIVSTGSHHSIAAPSKGVLPYVATKHAVLGLSEAMRTEHGDLIGISVLCPGIINTALWDAGRNRPAEYGGSFAGDPRLETMTRSLGMNPERVGELVAKGIEDGDFYIWTHPQDIDLINSRFEESRETILRQWPDGPTEEHKFTPHDFS